MRRWQLLVVAGLTGVGLTLGLGPARAAPAPPKEKRPLRVLVFTGASTREYQFLRTLLVRDKEKNKVDLKVFNQSGAPFKGLGDVDATYFLSHFPDRMEPAGKAEDDKAAALGSYDVVVAIDPDWQKLTAAQLTLVAKWVRQGGGLILVAGPVNTFGLSVPKGREQLKPIADLLPVVLDDVRLTEREAATPWRLNFGKVNARMTFLKLDPRGEGPLAGWEEFFTGEKNKEKGTALAHGFFGFYPVLSVKQGAGVLATFADPKAKIGDQEQPYMVTWAADKGLVFYLSSGETWRLRQQQEAFHERFWEELLSFASLGGASVKP